MILQLSSTVLWIILAIGFLILEAGTVALVSIWFALGAAAALICALLGTAFWVQALMFLIVSGALLALLRPMLRKHVKITPTNADRLIGTEGIVTKEINNITAAGQVKLGGMEWTARSSTGESIAKGSVIRVDRIEGVKVFVTPVKVPNTL